MILNKEKILEFCLEHELTKKDLAELAGLSAPTIHHIFAGKQSSFTTLKKLSVAMMCNYKDLIIGL